MCEEKASIQNPSESNEGKDSRTETSFEDIYRLYELYANIQIQADGVYFNRTSIFTLTQGLLLLAYQSTLASEENFFVPSSIAIVGLLVSLFWILFEQRNLIFYRGRGVLLRSLEAKMSSIAANAPDRFFVGLWTEVGTWVKLNAKWYQSFSAMQLQYLLIPALFFLCWLLLTTYSLLFYTPEEAGLGSKLWQAVSIDA